VDVDEYVIQYSDRESDMQNLYTKSSRSVKYNLIENGNIPLTREDYNIHMSTFDNNEDYYFRVYTLKEKNGTKYLTNGSKILHLKWDSSGQILEENTLSPRDVTLSEEDDEDEDASFPDVDMEGFSVSTTLDTQVNFKWSRPNLTNTEYDGFLVDIFEDSALSDLLLTIKAGRDITEVCAKGLTPDKTYYVKAYFYKKVGGENQKFGATDKKTATTEAAFTEEQLAKIEIKKANGLWPKDPLVCATVGKAQSEDTTSSDDEEDEDDSTTSSSSSTSSTSSTTKTSTTTSTRKASSGDIVLPKDVKSLTLQEAYTELRELALRVNKLRNWIRQLNLELEQAQAQQ
jgi:hypothetical protein